MDDLRAIAPFNQAAQNRAQANKYIIIFELPEILKEQNSAVQRESTDTELKIVNRNSMQFAVHGLPVPAISIPSQELPYAGQVAHVSSHSRPAYSPLAINFIINNTFDNYWLIWKWLNVLNDSEKGTYYEDDPSHKFGSKRKGNVGEYMTNLSVQGLNEYNKPLIEFRYLKAFPIGLDPISFSNRKPEALESTATFVFGQLDVKLMDPC